MRCRAFSPFVFIDYFTNLVYILHHSVKEGGVGEIHYQLLISMLQYGGSRLILLFSATKIKII